MDGSEQSGDDIERGNLQPETAEGFDHGSRYDTPVAMGYNRKLKRFSHRPLAQHTGSRWLALAFRTVIL